MKLPLRHFLLACLLLGAVALPLGWSWYQAQRAAEVEKLEQELGSIVYDGSFFGDPQPLTPAEKRRVAEIERRLVELTGKPAKPKTFPAIY